MSVPHWLKPLDHARVESVSIYHCILSNCDILEQQVKCRYYVIADSILWVFVWVQLMVTFCMVTKVFMGLTIINTADIFIHVEGIITFNNLIGQMIFGHTCIYILIIFNQLWWLELFKKLSIIFTALLTTYNLYFGNIANYYWGRFKWHWCWKKYKKYI